MAESGPFESPVVDDRAPSTGPLTLADDSATCKTIVRADAASYTGAQLGARYGSSRRLDGVLVCGQRPGEWILLGEPSANGDLVAALDTDGHVSVIDHTHARVLFRLTGADAPRALEKLCDLDWSDDMTPDGAVVSGPIAAVNCDVARDDVDGARSYLIACDRSFGQYLFDAILDAIAEFS